jgi:hypothetical protein
MHACLIYPKCASVASNNEHRSNTGGKITRRPPGCRCRTARQPPNMCRGSRHAAPMSSPVPTDTAPHEAVGAASPLPPPKASLASALASATADHSRNPVAVAEASVSGASRRWTIVLAPAAWHRSLAAVDEASVSGAA